MRIGSGKGFSLVEVVLALGIASFALLTLLALLPAGIKSNQISVSETEAGGILTILEADLRNTHPSAASGRSLLFNLPLPYALDNSGHRIFNPALVTNVLYTVALKDSQVRTATLTPPPPFQASIIYTFTPSAGNLNPIEARLIVNWIYRTTTSADDLTDLGKVSGFVETYTTFPAP